MAPRSRPPRAGEPFVASDRDEEESQTLPARVRAVNERRKEGESEYILGTTRARRCGGLWYAYSQHGPSTLRTPTFTRSSPPRFSKTMSSNSSSSAKNSNSKANEQEKRLPRPALPVPPLIRRNRVPSVSDSSWDGWAVLWGHRTVPPLLVWNTFVVGVGCRMPPELFVERTCGVFRHGPLDVFEGGGVFWTRYFHWWRFLPSLGCPLQSMPEELRQFCVVCILVVLLRGQGRDVEGSGASAQVTVQLTLVGHVIGTGLRGYWHADPYPYPPKPVPALTGTGRGAGWRVELGGDLKGEGQERPEEGVQLGYDAFPRVPTGTYGSRKDSNDDPYPYPDRPVPGTRRGHVTELLPPPKIERPNNFGING
ncbi:hypothetical protein C8F04DRAFT_1185553 [Mycena alexandri]|uniref:Uncharacterized protein n=1 Tax=Mycena alexandri TaxID=1745969 RepID=A0AAD6X0A5_9AGAR|nr:hypothetical protein C8F04DRAFT_1185553 [Mycena alexandri]